VISLVIQLLEVAEMPMKLSLVSLHKHSLGGCTIDMFLSTEIGQGHDFAM